MKNPLNGRESGSIQEVLELRGIKTRTGFLNARETGDDAAIRDVYRIEDEVDDLEEELRDKHIKRLSDGKCLPSNGVVFLDILSNLERMSDHAKNIAECVQEEISSN